MVGDFIKASKFFLLLLALLSLTWAVQLNVTVQDKDGTLLVSTTVQLLEGKTLVAEQKADDKGLAQFEVPAGTYFVKLIRSPYADHVVMLVASQDMPVTLVMLIIKPTYTLYGQIIDSPPDRWNGQKIYLVDANGAKMAETTVSGDGYYAFASLYPGVQYRVKAPASDGDKLSALFSYASEGAYYLEMDLRNSTVLVDTTPVLSAPSSAQLHSQISAVVRTVYGPVAGVSVVAVTPDGAITLTTDSKGLASVQAAKEGEYTFEYQNQSVKTVVGIVKQPETANPPPQEEQNQSAPIVQKTQPNAGRQQQQAVLFGGAGILLIAGAIIVIAVVGAIIYFMSRKKEKVAFIEEETKVEMHHEKHPVHEHGHEAHHEKHVSHEHGHEHAHHEHGHAHHTHEKK